MEKARVIVYYADNTIMDIYEFDLRTRKDGLSKPLCDHLWIANREKPEGGKIQIDFYPRYNLLANPDKPFHTKIYT